MSDVGSPIINAVAERTDHAFQITDNSIGSLILSDQLNAFDQRSW